jgi:NAD(P)-dependent dehydrogenase (short-subunit alcohol dehydrogenase family)
MDLQDKTALVTGGGVRIGRAIALALAENGCDLVIHYGRSGGPAEAVRDEARALGVRAQLHAADLADPAQVAEIVPVAVDAFGGLDVLINNAAIFPEEDRLHSVDDTLWDRLFAINLKAPFFLSQAFAAQRDANRRGVIVNLADARTRQPGSDHFAYRLTKGGVWQMTEMLAAALAPAVRVNAVALGAILPPPGRDERYILEYARRRVPLGHPGGERTVADGVLHLIAQDFVTGAVLPLDGGEFLGG